MAGLGVELAGTQDATEHLADTGVGRAALESSTATGRSRRRPGLSPTTPTTLVCPARRPIRERQFFARTPN